MHRVERSAIVPYPAEAMFDLVADVESYPDFLPGCTGARVHSREGADVEASIALAEGPLHAEFRTLNRLRRPASITMSLRQGPFRALAGSWEFASLGDQGCKVSLQMEFEFSSRAADLLLGPAFGAICGRLVGAFVRRAHKVYA